MDELRMHAQCPCGHAASWHADEPIARASGKHFVPGCQYKGSKDNPSRDGYDYCTCPTKRGEFGPTTDPLAGLLATNEPKETP